MQYELYYAYFAPSVMQTADGQAFINGSRTTSRDVQAAGAVFKYVTESSGRESIVAEGPTSTTVLLKVNYSYHYKYYYFDIMI